MRITYEKYNNSASLYIYFREFDGIVVSGVINLLGNLLFNVHNQWIGVEVSNRLIEGEKINLPQLMQPFISEGKEDYFQSEEKIVVIFDSSHQVLRKQSVYCNIDYNVNGLLGIEILVDNFEGQIDIANHFINQARK